MVGQAKRRATEIRSKAVGSGIFGRFPNFDECQSEVAGAVLSGVAVHYVDMNVRSPFDEYGLNSGRIIGPVLRITIIQYLIVICSRPEETSIVISSRFVGPAVPDNRVKFGDPCLNVSPEIPPEVVWGGTFDSFSR